MHGHHILNLHGIRINPTDGYGALLQPSAFTICHFILVDGQTQLNVQCRRASRCETVPQGRLERASLEGVDYKPFVSSDSRCST
jgi:hypothetical protein